MSARFTRFGVYPNGTTTPAGVVWAMWLAASCSVVAGCAAGHGAGGVNIPAEAEEAGERSGRMLFIAPAGGKLYILDARDGRIVFSASLRYGEKVFLDPIGNQVLH